MIWLDFFLAFLCLARAQYGDYGSSSGSSAVSEYDGSENNTESFQVEMIRRTGKRTRQKNIDIAGEYRRKQVRGNDIYVNNDKSWVMFEKDGAWYINKFGGKNGDLNRVTQRRAGFFRSVPGEDVHHPFEVKRWQQCQRTGCTSSRAIPFKIVTDAKCKVNLLMSMQWSGGIETKRMKDGEPINVTIALHVDSTNPVLTVHKVFTPDTSRHREFSEDIMYRCPSVSRDYRLSAIAFNGGFTGPQEKMLYNSDLMLIGLDIYELGNVVQFRYDLPVVFANFVGLPVSRYFQGDYTPTSDIDRYTIDPELMWFKQLETPYVKQILAYQWEVKPMEQLPEWTPLKRLYHMQLRPWPPLGITREMWWTKRRDVSFAKAFEYAGANAVANNVTRQNNDKSYNMQDFLKTKAFELKGACKECAIDDDDHFVFRQLNGYRPKGIRLLKYKPEYLKVPREMQYTIDRDIRNKKIFIIDASIVGTTSFKLNYAPILILKLERKNKLVPKFIQTHRKRESYLFTPNDSRYQWKLAKRLFEGVNSMEQTLSEHLLQSHLVLEVFAVAAYKSFSYNHPVYKLLYPHIKQILSINAYARTLEENGGGLIGKGGFVMRASPLSYENIHELFDRILSTWSPEWMHLPTWLENNGLNEDILDFPYALRDDGMKYWNYIEQYVTKVVDFHFDHSKEQVYFDPYIGAFLAEVKFAMEKVPFVTMWFFKKKRENAREELISLVSSIIWQATAGHTIENNPIWEYGGNPTLAPWKLDKPLPDKKPSINSLREYQSYLPKRDEFAKGQLSLMYALTDTMDDTEDLTDFTHLWVDPTVVGYVNEFKTNIASLEEVIKADHRRKNYIIPYDYLNPTVVKARIDI